MRDSLKVNNRPNEEIPLAAAPIAFHTASMFFRRLALGNRGFFVGVRATIARVFLFSMLSGSLSPSFAQKAVTNVFPITPFFKTWYYLTGGGTGTACGYYLYGRFPAYLDYTSRSDYLIQVFDTRGRSVTPTWQKANVDPYEEFIGGVSGTWAVGPGPISQEDCPQPYATSLLPAWTATLIVPAPRVSFGYNEPASTPGQVKFVSFATDPKRKKLELNWKFGDGKEDTFTSPTHEYEKPGEYNVVLRATNPAGAFDTATNKVVVKPPGLSVSISFVDRTDAHPVLGETVKVRAIIRASRTGLGALSAVHFAGTPVLGIPEVFQLVSAQETPNLGEMQPGDSRTNEWTLKVVNAGRFTFRNRICRPQTRRLAMSMLRADNCPGMFPA